MISLAVPSIRSSSRLTDGLFTSQEIRTFFQPAKFYKELGLPLEDNEGGKTRTVSSFVYFKAIESLRHGMSVLATASRAPVSGHDYVNLMSAYVHLTFGVVVWKYGGSRRKVGTHGVFAALFAYWYWQCWHSPGGGKERGTDGYT
ncbi:hypothetical protein BDW66DRAFT_147705 [Aspergillus desertorum]